MREELHIAVSSPVSKQDVKVTSSWEPTRNKRVPILHYQSQTFCLLSVLPAAQVREVPFVWWNLTNNLEKTCLLLKDSKSYSIWEKVDPEDLVDDTSLPWNTVNTATPAFVTASLLLLQSTHAEIDYLLGAKYAELFEEGMTEVFCQGRFPQADSSAAVQQLLKMDPWITTHMVSWQEQHLDILLQELYRLALRFFGNDAFTARVLNILEDLPMKERIDFTGWLKEQSSTGKMWKPTENYRSEI